MTTRYWSFFDTALGRCGLVWSERGIAGLQLPEPSDAATLLRLRACFPDAAERPLGPGQRAAVDRITSLLAGGSDDLTDLDLDLTGIGDFDRRVYAVARAIGPGRTRTYGDVAAALGSPGAAQAVGQALGRNPIPVVVPCHRVLAANGAVGGFSASGGTVTKRALLAAEHTPGFDDPALF
ncbi:methylated-DNA--[protein]-cysteine S-methyltransferase [Rhodococcus sp. NPDC058505]|uniref:methylated-DNA--[protein]-cysteine S-methyltransferase n=1 Tax=unclassified Rhodococcus (in: high G+C Gram-positive bacteria) TaxID=192944 RepID=UPI0036510FF2